MRFSILGPALQKLWSPSKYYYLTKSSWSDRFLSLIRICFSTRPGFSFSALLAEAAEIVVDFHEKTFKKINKSLINFAWPVTIKTCQVNTWKRPVIFKKFGHMRTFEKKHTKKKKNIFFLCSALIYKTKTDWLNENLRVSFDQNHKRKKEKQFILSKNISTIWEARSGANVYIIIIPKLIPRFFSVVFSYKR